MKPVTQEFPITDPKKGLVGDCLRAALASLLGEPIKTVPHFFKQHQQNEVMVQKALGAFLGRRGLMLLSLPFKYFAPVLKNEAQRTGQDCYHLMFGIDHDGDPHACVGLNGELVHDPHPLRRGFKNSPDEWSIGLMVSRNPDGGGQRAMIGLADIERGRK